MASKGTTRTNRKDRGSKRGKTHRRTTELVNPPRHRQIIINETEDETRIAIMEDHRLVELLVERESDQRLLGNIYKGRVTTVLPGMQAAFVDIGLERNAFLHFSDVCGNPPELDFEAGGEETAPETHPQPESITDVLHKGQEILVQVTKEAIGTKGPRVTTNISLPGRYLVLMPGVRQVGVSKRIEDREERRRAKQVVDALTDSKDYGFIVRTAAEGKSERDFRADARNLAQRWKRLLAEAATKKAPALLVRETGITTSIIRDLFTEDVDRLIIDSRKKFNEITRYLENFAPELKHRLELYEGDIPIFDCYEVEKELEACLDRKVPLPHGGYIGIDHTEALVAIDVNTGRYTGKKDPEETILRTNLDAAREIPRQLRLRDVGGIIVIDFIDMESEANKRLVLNELRAHLQRDRSRTKTLKVSDMGLVEMTRKRVGPSLLQRFSEPCPCCSGLGRVLSRETVAVQLERSVERAVVYLYETDLEVRVHPRIARYLEEERGRMKRLRAGRRVSVKIVPDESIELSKFRVISRETGRDLTDRIKA